MLTSRSRDERALLELVLDPERPVDASAEVRAIARMIRDIFVRGRGWPVERLAQYRFGDLAALSRPGEVALCRTAGTADWTRRQDDVVIELTLRQLRELSPQRHRRALRALTGGETVAEVLRERKLALSEEDWAYVDRLAQNDLRDVHPKSREGGAQLGRALVTLLERAYGR